MKLARITCMLAGFSALGNAQSWDTTGNGLLNGNYYFREVFFTSTAAVSLFGNIMFSGNGTYTINALGFQCGSSSCGTSPYQTSGTYSIGAGGFGFLSNGLLNSATIGGVGANGVFVGSATESGINDLFIAAPISGQNAGTFQGSYSVSYLEASAQVPYDALLQFSANGSGSIGNVNVSAYATSATPVTQTIGSVKYIVSNNAYVVTFPNSNTNVLTGQEYLYATPDGSFVFGGSPQDFDMLVGVRTGSGASGLGGFYYEAGMDFDDSGAASGNIFLDTFYGSFNAGANSAVVGHQRIQDGTNPTYSYVYHDAYPVELGSTYTDLARSRQFIVGGGVRIGLGLGPYPAMTVAVQGPVVARPGGMFLDPLSGVNAASYAPVTTGISSGELVTLTGTGLGPSALAVAGVTPLPTTVGGVQVLVNNHAVPILMASSTQVVIEVPYHTTAATALIQVTYKGAQSNTISTLVNTTTPGVFTMPLGGLNRAAARHGNGTLVTPANPAKVGETITVYLTGLGDTSVSVPDGGVGPGVTAAVPAGNTAVFIGGVAVTPSLLALAPGQVGVYQMKVAIPTGVTTGDVYLDIAGVDSYSSQATLAVTSSTMGIGTASRQIGARREMRQPFRSMGRKF